MELYKAQVACRIAGITPRMLDYWVTTGLIEPSASYQGPRQRRDFFLFSFEDLVRLRIIKALRRAGVSLQRVRTAIDRLKSRRGRAWQAEWIATDGVDVYAVTGNGVLESLAVDKGQLAFAVVALGELQRQVRTDLTQVAAMPFDVRRYNGSLVQLASTAGRRVGRR